MASKIRILDEKTINQIAAGEVIEGPASVVKELVDNALDAGSTQIVVEAINSGRQLVRVQDNGSGIDHDDLLLSIERHATSKIRSLEDLWELETMGFRGEALSSIASVSEFRIYSQPQDKATGTALTVHGGKITAHEVCTCLPGTTVEVKSLFFNVPARKKFLKSPVKDANDITKVLLQQALAHPEVAFELIMNHKREFSWQAKPQDARIKEVLGQEFYQELVSLSFENSEFKITGFVAQPTFSRPTRSYQYLYVNKRPVTSLAISHAVKEAYGSSIEQTRHPAFVLYVDVKPESLDVNVHPQKKEVRFSLEEQLKEAVIKAVTAALFTRNVRVSDPIMPMSVKLAAAVHTPYTPPSPTPTYEPITFVPESTVQVYAVVDDYIFTDIDGLSLVSTKRALSRLTHDGAKERGHKASVQTLLVPIFIELQPQEAKQLTAILEPLEKAGIVINAFGPSSFLVQAVPSYLEGVSIEDLIKTILEQEGDVAKALSDACKRTPTRQKLSVDSARHIVKKLMLSTNPYICPAGDKIIVPITTDELEKKFL